MKLFTFGDSWTEGVGGNLDEELQTNVPEERTKIRHKYCWPKHLSNLLNITFTNNGIGGSSNNLIFEMICHNIKEQIIQRDDFVVIMWSSYLRDDVPFFPNGHWHFWGERYKTKKYIYEPIFSKKGDKNLIYEKSFSKYREFFITNLYSDTYYNIVNQNRILFLQFMFEELGIRYLFCDAFDRLINENVSKEIDNTSLINTNHYWGFKEKTFRDFLIGTNRKDVWEDNKLFSNELGKHPNKNGYELIAYELYKWINEKNLLNYSLNEKPNIII